MPSTDTHEWCAFDVINGRAELTNWQLFDGTISLMSVRAVPSLWTIVIDTSDLMVAYTKRLSGADHFRLLMIRKARDA